MFALQIVFEFSVCDLEGSDAFMGYDGGSVDDGNEIFTLGASSDPADGEATSTSSTVTVRFTSDGSGSGAGFSATYRFARKQ